jgi:hypothetical protein
MMEREYETYTHIQGKVGHSGFAEFDNLTGYVTGNYVSEWQGRDGTRWRTITTVINLGRPDRGIRVDSEAAIVYEGPVPLGFNPRVQGKTEDLLVAIVELLQDRPLTRNEISTKLEVSAARVKSAIRHHPHHFRVCGHGALGNLYGAAGVTYAERVHLNGIDRIIAYLQAHGPSTVNVVCEALGMAVSTFYTAHHSNPGVLCTVGVTEPTGLGGPTTRIWDVA